MEEAMDKAVLEAMKKRTIKMQCNVAINAVDLFHKAASSGKGDDVAACLIELETLSTQLLLMLAHLMPYSNWAQYVEFTCNHIKKTALELGANFDAMKNNGELEKMYETFKEAYKVRN